VAALRRGRVPFRFVTNTTSRPRTELVSRLHEYGFAAEPHEILTPVTAAGQLARDRHCTVLAPFLPAASLVDLAGFELRGGVSGRRAIDRPQAVLVGDLGEQWTYALMQEAFGYVLDGALLVALSRDRYWRRADGLALDAGPFVAAWSMPPPARPSWSASPVPSSSRGGGRARAPVPAGESLAMIGDDLWSDVRGTAGRLSGLAGAQRKVPGGRAARQRHHAGPDSRQHRDLLRSGGGARRVESLPARSARDASGRGAAPRPSRGPTRSRRPPSAGIVIDPRDIFERRRRRRARWSAS